MLNDFSKQLRQKLGSNTDQRPFICEGNPLECKIFVVGINPATEMKRHFLDDWDDDYGFKKAEWLEHYISQRRETAVESGKRSNKVSNTRSRLEWIANELQPMKCLETNLYGKPTKSSKELNHADKDLSLFEFLIDAIRPKIIFLHG